MSEGCRHCYAEGMARRFSGPGKPFEGLVRIGADGERKAEWNGAIRFVEEHLLDPLRWKPVMEPCGYCREKFARGEIADFKGCVEGTERPRRVFVDSMSDLFHEGVTDEQLERVFAVMALCPGTTFQVLTKRPERMLAYLQQVSNERDMQRWANAALELDLGPFVADAIDSWKWPLPNVWLGVSVEDQKTADARIPLLLQTPVSVRFISAEPLLGNVNLESIPLPDAYFAMNGITGVAQPLAEKDTEADDYRYFTRKAMKLDWVICGGEGGPGARPMHPDWARGLRDQCVTAGVPFFFKQWGEWNAYIDRDHEDPDWRANYKRLSKQLDFTFINLAGGCGFHGERLVVMRRVGKKAAGDLLDGRQWHEFPKAVTA